jgi:DNA-binding response OmpR family regulator
MVGADAALLKPCDFDELRETVRGLMSGKSKDQAAPAG